MALYAGTQQNNISNVLPLAMDDFIIMVTLTEPKPDTTPPSKPTLVSPPPSSTYAEQVTIGIEGEKDSRVYLNGRYISQIPNSGRINIELETKGETGTKEFRITLKDSQGNISEPLLVTIEKVRDPKYDIVYKGLSLYHQPLPSNQYSLKQLSDAQFNTLGAIEKRQVANTLLSTLFFGYPLGSLQQKIDRGDFISSIYNALQEDRTDRGWLESHILDDTIFKQFNSWAEPQAITILTRFYAMQGLDNYFLKNWIAYTLTQTIMFSPAYELDTTHRPNISNTYNRIVNMLDDDAGMRYLTYIHMMSEENWRRFRSPEDNGREMLEIFLLDKTDSHVPIAAKALQNWKLDLDGDTLEVGLNENREPLQLFGTTIYNGDDFYRELVKSTQFTEGVTRRLVDYFFPNKSSTEKNTITRSIVSSHPENWQDILLQIVFSEAYLLHNKRTRSAEETFYSFAKKLQYMHRRNTFWYFKEYLEKMHQASMKYKLGKIKRVPLDSLSFAYYHKFVRQEVLLRYSRPDKIDAYDAWGRQGWSLDFVKFSNFAFDENNIEQSLENFINYIFKATISREATASEMALFKNHILYEENNEKHFHWAFDMFATYNDPERQAQEREKRKGNIASLVLDYISRLEETYTQHEVH